MRIEARRNPEQVRREAREYLKSTDWYTARLVDEGTAIPDHIKAKRAEARATLRQGD